MTALLLNHATMLVTMDADRREIADGAIFVRDNQIEWVGPTTELPPDLADSADTTINAAGKIVLPASSTRTIISTRRSPASSPPPRTPSSSTG